MPRLSRISPVAVILLLAAPLGGFLSGMSTLGMAAPRAKSRGKLGKPAQERPPKFDAETLEAFAPDAVSRLGPGAPGLPPPSTTAASGAGGESEAEGSGAVGGSGWSKIVGAESLLDELRAQLPLISEGVKSPSAYRGGGNKLAGRGLATVAVVFGVIAQYDGDVKLKKNAVGWRTHFAQAGLNSLKVNSDDAHKQAKLCLQELNELLSGGKGDGPKGDPDATWQSIVPRPTIMSRLDEAYQKRLKGWTADSASFAKHAGEIRHEAEMIAVLIRVMRDPSFDNSDEDDYKSHTGEIQKQCEEIIAALDAKNLERAQAAGAQIYKSCDACHEVYRGN